MACLLFEYDYKIQEPTVNKNDLMKMHLRFEHKTHTRTHKSRKSKNAAVFEIAY